MLSWAKTKTCRLSTMLAMTLSFFLVELIVGHITKSLALVGDSYHMLSDVVAIVVGIVSVRISKRHSRKNTYGWARAEVLGALVNSVFLIALCFTIFLEAIERLTSTPEIEETDLLLYVGIAGLVINIIGLLLFHGYGHGHSHGGHGHSHGGHGHDHGAEVEEENQSNAEEITEPPTAATNATFIADENSPKVDDVVPPYSVVVQTSPQSIPTCQSGSQSAANPTDVEVQDVSPEYDETDGNEVSDTNKKKIKSSAQLNMRGVFLHVLGDALGSVIVIISALIIKFVDGDWKYKVDPAMSMGLVTIVLCTTIPLFKESALILMQTVPTHIQVEQLRIKLIENVEGVIAIHEFHVWQLAGNRIIASAHIRCQNPRDYMRIAEQVKVFFHNEGIHSTTIQPEFVEFEEMSSERACVLECGPDKTCYVDTCCPRDKHAVISDALSSDPNYSNEGLRHRSRWTDPDDQQTTADGQFSDVIASTDFRSSFRSNMAETRA